MSEITVRPLTEADWETFREVRLDSLRSDPEAFAATLEDEENYDESFWRDRMNRSSRLVSEQDGSLTGVVSIGQATTDDHASADEALAEVFGLWVEPSSRGKGSATRLLRAAVDYARTRGKSHLVYWVGTDNGRAVAFASAHGFRPTDYRRPMGGPQAQDGDEEAAMVLPLAEDVGPQPRLD